MATLNASSNAVAAAQATNGSSNTPASKLKKATRAGAPNYNDDDINALLDITEDIEPLGANHWSIVASKFANWAIENSRSPRDQDSLKNKFDKLANMKKKTGDPSCPDNVRRAKHIARAIHSKCAALTLGDSSDDEEAALSVGSSDCSKETPRTPSDREIVGEQRKKRKTAATGTPSKAKAEHLLLEHIGAMSQHVGVMSRTIEGRTSDALSRSDVVSIVKEELRESMKQTNQLLSKMNSMLEHLTSSDRSAQQS